jgi:hypothetical protein
MSDPPPTPRNATERPSTQYNPKDFTVTKPNSAKADDLATPLAFTDSDAGEAVIADLTQRLRESESALAAHQELRDAAALKSDAALARHLEEVDAFERASTRLSVALEHARKRLADVLQTERQQAGEKARTEALALSQECGSLLLELLDQAEEIAGKLARWNTRREEVDRLNSIAGAGGAELVSMPQLPDEAEAAADLAAEPLQDLGKFLKDRSHEVWSRKQRARRLAEAEARKQADAPTEAEAAILRDKGFDPDILSREPRDADDRSRMGLVHQEIRQIRGLNHGNPQLTPRI